MKIGITLHPYGEKNPAGLGGIIYNLARVLSTQDHGYKIVFFAKGADKLRPDFLQDHSPHEFRTISSGIFWLDSAVRNNEDIDVWVFNTPMISLLKVPMRSVVIAMDFAYLHINPKSFKERLNQIVLRILNGRALKKATHIASISEFTAQEICTFFPAVQRQKITNIMSGYKDLRGVSEEPFSFKLPEDFYLSVGVIKERKNQLNIVRGFIKAKEQGLNSKLLICGSGSGTYFEKVKAEADASQFRDDIIFAGYVCDGQLVVAYLNARALIFPSIMEGFGMPVLEAMSLQVPVITSNSNSVAEVAGDAALKVNPESVSEIAAAVLKFADEETRRQYIESGDKRVKNFSWDKTASSLLNIIENKL